MRPLHSLLVVVALLVLAAGGWWLLRSGDPARRISVAGPAAAAPLSVPGGSEVDLRGIESEATPRRAETTAPAALAPAAAGESAGEAEAPAALAGRVLDPEGDPVAGARVLLAVGSAGFLRGTALDAEHAQRLFEVREVESDDEGRFRFEGVVADALRLAVRAVGYAPYDAVDLPRPASSILADVVLERGVRLVGRVVDAAGRAAGGVQVLRVDRDAGGPFRFGRQAAPVGTTAADGSFVIDVLAVGPWALEFESRRHPHALLEGRTVRPGECVEGLLVQLAEGASIGGRVTGSLPAGRSLTRLRVSATPVLEDDLAEAESRVVEVAGDGSFVVQGVRAGRRYVLRAVEAEGPRDDTPFQFLTGVAAPVEADAGESGVVLAISPEAALRFAVVDARSGAALEEFRVEAGVDWPQPLLDDRGRSLRNHPGGRVRVGELRPRSSGERASLRIEALGYRPYETSDLRLTPGMDTDLGTIALEPAPLLTVRVVDAANGAPIAGADVQLSEVLEPEVEPGGGMRRRVRATIARGDVGELRGDGEQRNADTGDDGRARLNAIGGRDARLRVRASGYAPAIGEPFRGSGEAEEREVRLTRGGAVRVHLFDAAGEPLAGGRVEHRAFHDDEGLPEFRSPALTDEEGQARFEHLAPGRHRFRRAGNESGGVFSSGGSTFAVMVSGDEDGGDDWVAADVVEGGEHDVEIHLPLSLAVYGRVTEAGEALADATLSLIESQPAREGMPPMPMFGGEPQASSDADGRWRFEDVEPGTYTLRVAHSGRAMPSEVELEVVDREVEQDVDLDLSILEGRVLDPAGKPLAGIEVWAERARDEGASRGVRIMAFAGGGGGNKVTMDSGGGETVRARSDGEGRYVLRGVRSGIELVVRGRGDGLQPGRSERVRLAADEHRRGLDLTLETAGQIDVEGVFADGSPAANLLITARYEGPETGVEPQTILLDDTGHGRIDGLAPGPWRLTGRSIGPSVGEPPPAELSVSVVAGASTPARLRAP